MAATSQGSVVKSADRVISVLEDLARNGPGTLQDLTHRLAIPMSSLHGVLHTLLLRGWVQLSQPGKLYSIGVRAAVVAGVLFDTDSTIAAISPVLDRLVRDTSETVQLARLQGTEIVYLAKRLSPHPVALVSKVGGSLPAHATALGKAILSTRSDEQLDALLSFPLARVTARTLCTRRALYDDLAETRARGYATERGESADGLTCFAIPLEWDAVPVDAISVSLPINRATDAAVENIVEALTAIQDEFGDRRPADAVR